MSIEALDRASIATVDTSDQLTDVLALPEHLRDAVWKAESAGMQPWDSPAGLVVAGMGQSAMGGQLAAVALGDHASRPVSTARAYGLPVWTTPETTVLCCSYSGNTEETLASYEAAGALGAKRVVTTAGGRLAELARADGVPVLPMAGGLRAPTAIGYAFVAALEVAALCGVGPRMTSEIDVAAEHLEELVSSWGPDARDDSPAKELARALQGTVPVIAGASLTAPLARRMKAQLNTVARVPAFASELPDVDHTELSGWAGAEGLGPFSVVFLEDTDTHPRVSARIALTRDMVEAQRLETHMVASRGQTTVERVLSLVLFGDLVAHYLGALRGVDPGTPSDVDRLKEELTA